MRKKTLLLLLLYSFAANAQNDTSVLQNALLNAVNAGNDRLALFNGKEHIGYPPGYIGNPYFLVNDWMKGSLDYAGVYYTDLQMKYDLLKNEVIVKHTNGFSSVSLFTPRVLSFTIAGHQFTQVFNKEKDLLPPGVYEILQTGKMSLYVTRSKTVEENVTASAVEKNIIDKNSYYVVVDGVAYPIRKQNSITDLLGSKKGAVKAHLKEMGLKYKNNRETTLIEIVKFYNQ